MVRSSARPGRLALASGLTLLGSLAAPADAATFSLTLDTYATNMPLKDFAITGTFQSGFVPTGVKSGNVCGAGSEACEITVKVNDVAVSPALACSLNMVAAEGAGSSAKSRLYAFVTTSQTLTAGAVTAYVPAGCFTAGTDAADTSAAAGTSANPTAIGTAAASERVEPTMVFSSHPVSQDLWDASFGSGATGEVKAYFSEAVTLAGVPQGEEAFTTFTNKFQINGAEVKTVSVANGVATVQPGQLTPGKAYTISATSNAVVDSQSNYLATVSVAKVTVPTTVKSVSLLEANKVSTFPAQLNMNAGSSSTNVTSNTKVILRFAHSVTSGDATKLKFQPAPTGTSVQSGSGTPLMLVESTCTEASTFDLMIADMPLQDSHAATTAWQMGWDKSVATYVDKVDWAATTNFKGVNFTLQATTQDRSAPAEVCSRVEAGAAATERKVTVYFDEKVKKTTNTTVEATLTEVSGAIAARQLKITDIAADTAGDQGKVVLTVTGLKLGRVYKLALPQGWVLDKSGNDNMAAAKTIDIDVPGAGGVAVSVTGDTDQGTPAKVPVTATLKLTFSADVVVERGTGSITVACNGTTTTTQTIAASDATKVLVQGQVGAVVLDTLPAKAKCSATVAAGAFVGLGAASATFDTHDVDSAVPAVVTVGCGAASGSCTDVLKVWPQATNGAAGNEVVITFNKPVWGNSMNRAITLTRAAAGSTAAVTHCFVPYHSTAGVVIADVPANGWTSEATSPATVCASNAGRVKGMGTKTWTLSTVSLEPGTWTLTVPADAVQDSAGFVTSRPQGNNVMAEAHTATITVSTETAGPQWAAATPVQFSECDRTLAYQRTHASSTMGALYTRAAGATECMPTAMQPLFTAYDAATGAFTQQAAADTGVTAPSDEVVSWVLTFDKAITAGTGTITVEDCGTSASCSSSTAVHTFTVGAANVEVSGSSVTLWAPSKLTYTAGSKDTKRFKISDGAIKDAKGNGIVCNGGKWKADGSACQATVTASFVQDKKSIASTVAAADYGASKVTMTSPAGTTAPYYASVSENILLEFTEPVYSPQSGDNIMAVLVEGSTEKPFVLQAARAAASGWDSTTTNYGIFSADGKKLALLTSSANAMNFNSGTVNTLKIKASAKLADMMGNGVAAEITLGTLQMTGTDATAPKLFFTEPFDKQQGVATSGWTMNFIWSEKVTAQATANAVKLETVSPGGSCPDLTVANCGGTASTGGCAATGMTDFGNGVTQLDIINGLTLAAGCTYKVTIAAGAVQDAASTGNAATTIEFTTGFASATDTAVPTMSSVTPATTTKNVATSPAGLTFQFSEAVMPFKVAGTMKLTACTDAPDFSATPPTCTRADQQSVTLSAANTNWPFGTHEGVATADKVYFYGKRMLVTYGTAHSGLYPEMYQSLALAADTVMDTGYNKLAALSGSDLNYVAKPTTAAPTFLACEGLDVSAAKASPTTVTTLKPVITCYTSSKVTVSPLKTATFSDVPTVNTGGAATERTAVVSLAADGMSMTFTPSDLLSASKTYALTWEAALFSDEFGVGNAARSKDGNNDWVADSVGNQYYLAVPAAGSAPTVSHAWPSDATQAFMYDQVRVIFSAAVVPVANKYVRIKAGTTVLQEVAVTAEAADSLAYSQDMKRMWVGVQKLLVPGTQYTVEIEAGAFTASGQTELASAAHSWSFTVSQKRDNVKPLPFLVARVSKDARGNFDAFLKDTATARVHMSERVAAASGASGNWQLDAAAGGTSCVSQTTAAASATIGSTGGHLAISTGWTASSTAYGCSYTMSTSAAGLVQDKAGNTMDQVTAKTTSLGNDPATNANALTCSDADQSGCAAYTVGMDDTRGQANAQIAATPSAILPDSGAIDLANAKLGWNAPQSTQFVVRVSAAAQLTNGQGKITITQRKPTGVTGSDVVEEIAVTDTSKVKLLAPAYRDIIVKPSTALTYGWKVSVSVSTDAVYAATRTPAASLAANQKCCTENTGAYNAAGTTKSVTVMPEQAAGDVTAPTFTASTPTTTTSLLLNPTFTVTLSEDVAIADATKIVMQLASDGSTDANAPLTCASSSATVISCHVVPPKQLMPSTSYKLAFLQGAVKDTAGNFAAAASFPFTSMSQDKVSPTAYVVTPADGFQAASPTTDVVFVFSEQVQRVGTSAFKIGSTDATVSANGARLTLRRAAGSGLASGSQAVTVPAGGVTDMTKKNAFTFTSHTFQVAGLAWAGTLPGTPTSGYNSSAAAFGLEAHAQGALVALPTGRLVLIGGKTAAGACMKALHSADKGKTWSALPLNETTGSLGEGFGRAAAYQPSSKSVFVLGGQTCSGSAIGGSLLRLAPNGTSLGFAVSAVTTTAVATRKDGVWARGGAFPPAFPSGGDGVGMVVLGSWQLFLAGGGMSSVWRSETEDASVWRELRDVPFGGRLSPLLAPTRSGRLYVVGGWDGLQVAGQQTYYNMTHDDVWQTDNFGESWQLTTAKWLSTMPARSWFAGATLPDDTVVITGGLQYNTTGAGGQGLLTSTLLSSPGPRDTAAPTVRHVSAPSSLTPAITVYFDEAVVLSTGNGAEFGQPMVAAGSLSYPQDTAAIEVLATNSKMVTLSKDKRSIVVKAGTLVGGKTYSLVLGEGFVSDLAGNRLAKSTVVAVTTPSDTVGPVAASSNALFPADAATDVSSSTSLRVAMSDDSHPIKAVANKTLQLVPVDTSKPKVTLQAADAECFTGRAAGVADCLWGTTGLVQGQKYTATLEAGAFVDALGHASAAAVSWSFTVTSGKQGGSYLVSGLASLEMSPASPPATPAPTTAAPATTTAAPTGNASSSSNTSSNASSNVSTSTAAPTVAPSTTPAPDTTAPVLVSGAPWKLATDASSAQGFDVAMQFSEPVRWNSSGQVVVTEGNASYAVLTLSWNATTAASLPVRLVVNGSWAILGLSGAASGTFKPGKMYWVQIKDGSITDFAGNKFAGTEQQASHYTFSTLSETVETAQPEVLAVSPSHTSTVSTRSDRLVDVKVWWTEAVAKGVDGVTVTFDQRTGGPLTVAASSVNVTGRVVTVQFNASEVDSSLSKLVTMDFAQLVKDSVGNSFNSSATSFLTGALGAAKVQFQLGQLSTTAVTLTEASCVPAKASVNNEPSEVVKLAFSTAVVAGEKGKKISLRGKHSGKSLRTWTVGDDDEDDGLVWAGASVLLWHPEHPLAPGEEYTLHAEAGAIRDAVGNAFDGSALTYGFSVAAGLTFTETAAAALPANTTVRGAAVAAYDGCKSTGDGECESSLWLVGGYSDAVGSSSARQQVIYLATRFDAACGSSYPPFGKCGADLCKAGALAPARTGAVYVAGGLRGRQCADAQGKLVNSVGAQLTQDPFRPECQCPACIEGLFDSAYGNMTAPANILASSESQLRNMTQTAAGGNATFQCATGYYSSAPFQCVVSNATETLGTWASPFPQCLESPCLGKPVLGNGNNGACSVNSTQSQSTCPVTCDTGYENVAAGGASFNLTCLRGVWQTSQQSCEPVTCAGTPSETNALTSSCAGQKYSTSCVVSCAQGFASATGAQDATYQCGADKQWALAQGSSSLNCQPVTCPAQRPTGTPANVAANATCASTAWKGTCTLACAANFTGTVTATCTDQGQWSMPTGQCASAAQTITGSLTLQGVRADQVVGKLKTTLEASLDETLQVPAGSTSITGATNARRRLQSGVVLQYQVTVPASTPLATVASRLQNLVSDPSAFTTTLKAKIAADPELAAQVDVTAVNATFAQPQVPTTQAPATTAAPTTTAGPGATTSTPTTTAAPGGDMGGVIGGAVGGVLGALLLGGGVYVFMKKRGSRVSPN